MIDELLRGRRSRLRPCRDCGEVKTPSPTEGEEDFCIECAVEHWIMRRITLAPDRYCPHCQLIRFQDGFGHYPVVWREDPTCLACEAAAYFPKLAPEHVAPLCLRCEAAQTFEGDVFCPVCGAIADFNLEPLLAVLQEEWDELAHPDPTDGVALLPTWEAYITSVQVLTRLFDEGGSDTAAVLAEVRKQFAYLRGCENAQELFMQELLRNDERAIPLWFLSPRELKRLYHGLLRDQEGRVEPQPFPPY